MIGPPPRRKKNQYRVSKLPPFGELTVVARWEERIVNVNFAISAAVYMVTVRQLALCNRKIASWPELCKIDKTRAKPAPHRVTATAAAVNLCRLASFPLCRTFRLTFLFVAEKNVQQLDRNSPFPPLLPPAVACNPLFI
jgi:hypothetical protein